MNVFIRPTGAPLGQTLGFGPNGSSASLDTAAIETALATGDLVLIQRNGALVKILASAFGSGGPATGDISASTVTLVGTTIARSLAARAGDWVDVLDFGADPTGLSDSAPAFNAALTSVGSGQAIRIRVPRGSYLLNSVINTQGRLATILMDDGADIAAGSPGYFGATREVASKGAYSIDQVGGGYFGISQATGSFTAFDTKNVTNSVQVNSTVLNRRIQNTNRYATTGGTQDQAFQAIVDSFTLMDGSSQWMRFEVVNSCIYGENEAATMGYAGSCQYGELDVVNNGPNTGYTVVDSIGTPAAGLAVDPSGGNFPYLGDHIRWAFGSAGGVSGGNTGLGSLSQRWWTYPALFSATNASTGVGAQITITATDGAGNQVGPTVVTVGGAGALSDWATAINAAGISHVAAAVNIWGGTLSRLVIYSTVANWLGSITLAGAGLATLGYTAGTYFTPRQTQYVTVKGGQNITGAAGATITLNGNTIVVGGAGTSAAAAAAINGAAITGITAGVNVAGYLVIEAWAGSQQLAAPYWSGQVFPSLTIGGTGVALLGLTAGTYYPAGPPAAYATAWSDTYPATVPAGCVIKVNGTNVAVSGSSTAIAAAIQAAAIPNVQAFIRTGNRLGIRNTAGGTVTLQDVTGRALDLLRMVPAGLSATFQPGGVSAGSFNVFYAALDSIAPGGVGLFVGGSSYADISVHPFAPIDMRNAFQHGIRTDAATFDDAVAFRLAQGNAIAAGGPGADQQLVFGNGTVRLSAQGQAKGQQLGQLYGTSASGAAVRLTADGNAAGAGNSWPVAAGHALFGAVAVLAVNPATTDIACWKVDLAARNAGTLSVAQPGTAGIAPTYSTGGMSAASLAIVADTVNGAISLTVTPPASTVADCEASFIGAVR
nr:hypothetical protein [uncultured Rhodopila sp.]